MSKSKETTALDLTVLTRAFVNIRDARIAASHEFDKKDKELKAKQDRVGNAMLKFLNEHNMDSVATEAGTFYRQMEITPTGSDWEKFYQWVKDNDAFDALERRIKKNFIREYIEEKGETPPGVSVFKEFVVRVRRS